MLPTQLLGIYRQYKQDTDSVAVWLASTAKSCGYPAHLLTSLEPKIGATKAAQNGRLKGKNRSKARAEAQGKTGQNPSTAAKTPKHVIAIKDFVPLALFIAGRDPSVAVPDVFSATVDRLITLRSEFGGKLADKGSQPDPGSDEKHGYFVGVLKQVRQTLRPASASAATIEAMDNAIESSSGTSKKHVNDIGGKFAALSVEEPSKAFLEAFRNQPHQRPEARDEDQVSYEAEPQTSLEDVMFAFTILLNDLGRIRSRIKWIWSNHRDGLLDLAASAVATNTAISIARGLIEEVAPLLDSQAGGAWGTVNKFYFMVCLDRGFRLEQIYVYDKKDNFNYDLYETADECYVVAGRLLESFSNILQPKHLPLIKEGMIGTYDPDSDRASKTGQEKFLEDQILLMEYFTELITVIRMVPDYPVEDEFLREMRKFEKTLKVPFSLIFVAQIFLDIHHTMRATTLRSFEALNNEVNVMNSSLDNHLDFHKDLKMKNWPASNDHVLRNLIRLMKWMGKDPVKIAKAKVYAREKVPVPAEMTQHRIFIYSPVLSGLYLFRLRSEMYDVGLAVANAWGSIAYPAHLYNALCRERLLQNTWPDMDVLLTNIGDSSFWVGGDRPGSAETYFQKFCLQMGVSAAALTRTRREGTATASRSGPRGINAGAPLASMFKTSICGKTDMNWTAEVLDDFVARSQWESTFDDEGLVMTQIDDAHELRARNRSREQKAKAVAAGRAKTVGFVPEKLTESLVLALHSETLEMVFPYLPMHRWCWQLLRSIRSHCDPVLRELYTSAYMETEGELPWVVGYIFMAASGLEGPRDMRLLQLAAECFDAMIGSEAGQMAIEIARKVGVNIQFEEE